MTSFGGRLIRCRSEPGAQPGRDTFGFRPTHQENRQLGRRLKGAPASPVQIGYRSFDRQRIISDKCLINQPNPRLWAVRSEKQRYLTAISRSSPTSGPGLTCTWFSYRRRSRERPTMGRRV
ncbi:MAG: type ISP restriction/modification enzyme [Pseudonocardia sp.]